MLEWVKAVGAIVYVGVALALWGVGFWGFLGVARASGIGWFGPLSGTRIYVYAFREMRGSRETRRIVVGFGSLIVWLILGGMALGAMLDALDASG